MPFADGGDEDDISAQDISWHVCTFSQYTRKQIYRGYLKSPGLEPGDCIQAEVKAVTAVALIAQRRLLLHNVYEYVKEHQNAYPVGFSIEYQYQTSHFPFNSKNIKIMSCHS